MRDMPINSHYEFVIIGAGPAGIAAASTACEPFNAAAPSSANGKVLVIDNMPLPGGNIWRGPSTPKKVKLAGQWFNRMNRANPARLSNATVFAIDVAHKRLHVETSTSVLHVTFNNLLLATGARELFI